jgi:hypothetical protein
MVQEEKNEEVVLVPSPKATVTAPVTEILTEVPVPKPVAAAAAVPKTVTTVSVPKAMATVTAPKIVSVLKPRAIVAAVAPKTVTTVSVPKAVATVAAPWNVAANSLSVAVYCPGIQETKAILFWTKPTSLNGSVKAIVKINDVKSVTVPCTLLSYDSVKQQSVLKCSFGGSPSTASFKIVVSNDQDKPIFTSNSVAGARVMCDDLDVVAKNVASDLAVKCAELELSNKELMERCAHIAEAIMDSKAPVVVASSIDAVASSPSGPRKLVSTPGTSDFTSQVRIRGSHSTSQGAIVRPVTVIRSQQ